MTSKVTPVILLILAMGLSHSSAFGDTDKLSESRQSHLRAAFIFNFISFIEWPSAAADTAKIEVGVWNDEGSLAALIEELSGKKVKGKEINFKAIGAIDSGSAQTNPPVQILQNLRVLTIDSDNRVALKKLIESVSNLPILTVSRYSEHCSMGIVMCFVIDDGRLRFTIDKKAADKAGLKIGSQLLKLARPAP
jgi:hypothetical protein